MSFGPAIASAVFVAVVASVLKGSGDPNGAIIFVLVMIYMNLLLNERKNQG